MGVLQRIIFSHTPDEAMAGGLAKACVPGKIVLFQRKLEFLNHVSVVQLNVLWLIYLDHIIIQSPVCVKQHNVGLNFY